MWRGRGYNGWGIYIRLQLINKPPSVIRCFIPFEKTQLQIYVTKQIFANAYSLPRKTAVFFRFHLEPDQPGPVYSFNITNLLFAKKTTEYLRRRLGPELINLFTDNLSWNKKSFIKLKLLPALDILAANPKIFAEISSTALQKNPLIY